MTAEIATSSSCASLLLIIVRSATGKKAGKCSQFLLFGGIAVGCHCRHEAFLPEAGAKGFLSHWAQAPPPPRQRPLGDRVESRSGSPRRPRTRSHSGAEPLCRSHILVLSPLSLLFLLYYLFFLSSDVSTGTTTPRKALSQPTHYYSTRHRQSHSRSCCSSSSNHFFVFSNNSHVYHLTNRHHAADATGNHQGRSG